MHPLRDGDRRRLLYLAAVLCAVPVLLVPLAGRSTYELREERVAFEQRFTVPVHPAVTEPPISVSRDPFVADSASSDMDEHKRAANGPVAVEAVITGSSPRALVEEHARVRIVGIGDALAGSTVALIDRTGIRLQNGSLLPLSEQKR